MSHTEKYCAGDYTKELVKQSKLLGNGSVYQAGRIRQCPRCGLVSSGDFPHGELLHCEKCGLNMKVWGNALYISDGEIEDWMT
jgi:ribosomal protein S27AE